MSSIFCGAFGAVFSNVLNGLVNNCNNGCNFLSSGFSSGSDLTTSFFSLTFLPARVPRFRLIMGF